MIPSFLTLFSIAATNIKQTLNNYVLALEVDIFSWLVVTVSALK